MDIQFRTNSNNTFTAKVGPNLLKEVSCEFSYNQKQIKKFVGLFNSVHSNNLDKETVVDINGDNHYILSHLSFPNIFCILKEGIFDSNKPVSTRLINECSRVFAFGERLLFQEITRTMLNKINIDNLEQFVKNNIKMQKSQNEFLEIIECAKRLIQEYPNAKLSDGEFEGMSNIILNEKANTPGTSEYELIRNIYNRIRKN